MIAIGKIAISILSAYAVVYFKFPFRMTAFWLIFMTLMLPVEVRIYPTYKIAADLSLLDTYAGLTIPLIASATATLFFRQFFMTIPDELIEASKLDGAGPLRFFKDTVLPLSRTNIAALFVILFIYGWNQYLWPLLITTRDDMQTIVIGIKKMIVTADALTEWNVVHGHRHARHAAAGGRGDPDAALVRARAWWRRRSDDASRLSSRNFAQRSIRDPEADELVARVPVLVALARLSGHEAGMTRRYAMASVTLDNVRKVYAGGVEAVKGVSLAIPDGSFTVLLGPSGCGKSTLLRMIAGLETITSGTISIGGRVVNDVEPADRDIAMVFQNYALYPHMSVYDNMAYGLRNRGVAQGRDRGARGGSRALLGIDAVPRAQAARAVRRPAPARRHGPRHRARAAGVPVRRAAVEPRRQAARADAHRDPPPAQPAEGHLDLRHPRPGRGDDARRHGGGDERAAASSRSARRPRSTASRRRSSSRPSSARRP